jgi:hypothetical protein
VIAWPAVSTRRSLGQRRPPSPRTTRSDHHAISFDIVGDDELAAATVDDLIEAELVAIDAGDPESAVIIAAELERRRTRG